MKIIVRGKMLRGKSWEEKMNKLFFKLNLEETRYSFMYTLTSKMYFNEYFQFRAWEGPFANISSSHVDTGNTEALFQISYDNRRELLNFVQPIIKGRALWTDSKNNCQLWLAFHR